MHVLVIAPYYSIYPPVNGGMLRVFHILNQLAKRYDTTAIILQDREAFITSEKKYPLFENCEIITASATQSNKSSIRTLNRLWEAVLYRVRRKSLKGPTDTLFLKYYLCLKNTLKRKKPDIIIFENLSCINSISIIKRISPDAKIVLDAHNVDSDLAYLNYLNGLIPKYNWKYILKLESSLYKYIDGFFACSIIDQKKLLELNKMSIPSAVIPNGIEIEEIPKSTFIKENSILFCGSLDYYPNIEGISWFLKECWFRIKNEIHDTKLYIIGSGLNDELNKIFSQYIDVYTVGKVPLLTEWYLNASIVIVPILQGSGTRLKILEGMKYKKPIISTTKGAEGINYINETHLMIADTPIEFSKICVELIRNKSQSDKLALNGFNLVNQEYNWDIIGDKLQLFLKSLV